MEIVTQPPPSLTSLPPPITSLPPPPIGSIHGNNISITDKSQMHRPFHNRFHSGGGGGDNHHFGAGKPGHPFFKPFNFNRGPGGVPMSQDDFDGKRLRKSVMRKTVDYNASIVRELENRIWQRDFRDRHALQPENIYIPEMLPPPSYLDNPANAVTTKFVKTATNKMRCPIFTLAWTPEGRRLVTGASSGEFTLWNGLTFNFETILQAHDVPVRTMVWSHNDSYMITGDHSGYVKYWQSNMNNVKMYQAHKEPIRGISFSPTDSKFVSCSDDGTLRVWDFLRCTEEKVLRGHGADVKCVHWHPQKSLIVSGSKDNQQPIKLWDPKSGSALATLHAHKSTVMDLKWNDNGNWLITASRDHLLKLFDLRNLREEVQVFRGHKKEASSVSWHPIHEGLFASGGSDGSILFWNVGTDKEIGNIENAHESIVWTLAWHPLGHILCSGSNDHTIKFWTRNRPGDLMRDKYNLNTLPASLAGLDECDLDENLIIPGMGPEDKVEFTESLIADTGVIPGLELDTSNIEDKKEKKVPYSKPIPRNFQAQWNDTGNRMDDDENSKDYKDVLAQLAEKANSGIPVDKIGPTAIVVYGIVVPVPPGSNLQAAILAGPDSLNRYISSGEVKELLDVLPPEENTKSSTKENTNNTNNNNDAENSNSSTEPRRKKSRFSDAAPVKNHNAQVIYGHETDFRHVTGLQPNQITQLQQIQQQAQQYHQQQMQQQMQQQQQQQQQKPFIPSLLNIKIPEPEEFKSKISPRDSDFRFTNNDDDEDDDIAPWETSGSGGFPSNNSNFNTFMGPNNNMFGNPSGPGPNFINNNNNFQGPDNFGGNFNDNINSVPGRNNRSSRFNDMNDNERFNNFDSNSNDDNFSRDNNRGRNGMGGNNNNNRMNNNRNMNNNNRNRNNNRRF